VPTLHQWISQQVDERERDPHADRRRCEADRRILARHRLADWPEPPACLGCGTYGEYDHPATDNLNDCPELLDLACAHGLTDRQLAELDRPQPPLREPTAPYPTALDEARRRLLNATPARQASATFRPAAQQ
jgi:hypothetical protein